MAINFPTSLDTLTNPTGANPTTSPDHATQHSNVNDICEALEAKVGIDGSAVTTSHDYKLSGVTGSDKAASKTGSETLTNKTLTSPVINGATGTGGTFTGVVKSSGASSGIGYATGAGSTVTQGTSKSTAVTINAICGEIVMHNATLNGTTSVQFTVNNTSVAAADVVILSIASGATANSYTVMVDAVAANSFKVSLRNYTGGGLSEAVVINFAIIKSVVA